jgi:hypothetical protein
MSRYISRYFGHDVPPEIDFKLFTEIDLPRAVKILLGAVKIFLGHNSIVYVW